MAKFRYIFVFICLALSYSPIVAQSSPEQRAFLYADKLYQDGFYEIAIEQYRQYLSDYPRGSQRAEAELQIGRALVELQQFDAARKTFLEVDLDYPGTREAQAALWLIATSFEQEEKWERAAKAYQRLFLYYPEGDSAKSALLEGADNALKARNSDLAVSLLNAVVDNFYSAPEAIEARIQLAEIYIRTGDLRLAWNELDKALYSSPTEIQRGKILIRRAQVAERLFGQSRAEQIYNTIIDEFKRDTLADRAMLELGRLALEQHQYETAADYFEDPEDSDSRKIRVSALENHGDQFWGQEQYQQAADMYSQALQLTNNSGATQTIRLKYALALEQLERVAEAFEFFSEVSRQAEQPGDSTIRNIANDHLATVAARTGAYRKALRALRDIRGQGNPEAQANVLHRMGDIYSHQLEDYQSAVAPYQAIEDSFPRYTAIDKVLFSLGKVQTELEQYSEAEQTFRRLMQQYPYSFWHNDAEEHLWFLDLQKSTGQNANFNRLAELFGELLLERNPKELYYKLGMIYFREQRNYEAAIQQFQSLLQEDISRGLQDSIKYFMAEGYRIQGRLAAFRGETASSQDYYSQAVSRYEDLLSSQPLAPEFRKPAQRYLFELYIRTNPQQAVQYIQTPDTTISDDEMVYLRARANRSAGNDSAAYEILDNYLQGNLGATDSADLIAMAASLANELGKKEESRKYCEWYAANFRNSNFGAESWWILLQYAMEDSQYTEAKRLAERIRAEAFYTPYYHMVNEQIGELYTQTGAYVDAGKWYESLANKGSAEETLFAGKDKTQNIEAVYHAAEAYAAAGQTKKAGEFYQWYLEIGEKYPYLADASAFLADQSSRNGSYQEAREYYLRALSALPDTQVTRKVDLRMAAARMLFEMGQYENAADEFLELAEETSGETRFTAWEQGIISEIRAGRSRRAGSHIDDYREAAELKENALPLLRFRYEQAKMLAEEKKFQQSIPMLQSILEAEIPEDFRVRVRYELGRQNIITNNYEEAIDMLTSLTVEYPNHPLIAQVYITLGTVYYEQEQPANAIEAYRNALNQGAMDEYKKVAMSNLIKLYDERGLWDAAIALGKRYATEFPNAEDQFATRIQIGTFLMNMREYDRAIDHLTALLREANAEQSSEIQFWIGEAYFNQAKYQQAIIEYLKVPYLNPPTKLDWAASALWKAGNAYEKLRQNDKAIRLYERIIREKGAASNFGRFARRRIDELEAQKEAAE